MGQRYNIQYAKIYDRVGQLRRSGQETSVTCPKGVPRASVIRAINSTLKARHSRGEIPFTCTLSTLDEAGYPLAANRFRIIRK